jgi:hypothetical protein
VGERIKMRERERIRNGVWDRERGRERTRNSVGERIKMREREGGE